MSRLLQRSAGASSIAFVDYQRLIPDPCFFSLQKLANKWIVRVQQFMQ